MVVVCDGMEKLRVSRKTLQNVRATHKTNDFYARIAGPRRRNITTKSVLVFKEPDIDLLHDSKGEAIKMFATQMR